MQELQEELELDLDQEEWFQGLEVDNIPRLQKLLNTVNKQKMYRENYMFRNIQ